MRRIQSKPVTLELARCAVICGLFLFANSAIAGERDGLTPGLYFGEVGLGAGLAAPIALFGFYLAGSTTLTSSEGWQEPHWFWVGVTASYPFIMTAGTLIIGENFGEPSENRGTTYLATTGVSFGVMALSAGIGAFAIDWDDSLNVEWLSEALFGISLGVIPTAFVNALVYNRIRKTRTPENAALTVTPYIYPIRTPGRNQPLKTVGITLTF